MRARRIRALRDELINDLALDRDATTADVCARLCQVMADRIREEIQLRFEPLGDGVSGVWARSADRKNLILVTTAHSWMHRLHILCHELAHMLCGHTATELSTDEARRFFYPDLPDEMFTILASRTTLNAREEQEADQVAVELLKGLFAWASKQDIPAFRPAADDDLAMPWYTLGFTPRDLHE